MGGTEILTDNLLLDRWFGRAMAEDYVAWAVELLVQQYDTPSLRILASFHPHLEREEVDGYFLRTCEELDVRPLAPDCDPRMVVPLIRRQYQSRTLTAAETLGKMSELSEATGYTNPLLGLWFIVGDDYAPEILEDLEKWMDQAWADYECAEALELPSDFPKFVGCENCGHIGLPAPWPKFPPKQSVRRKPSSDAFIMPYICAICGASPAKHIGHTEVLNDYLSRLKGR